MEIQQSSQLQHAGSKAAVLCVSCPVASFTVTCEGDSIASLALFSSNAQVRQRCFVSLVLLLVLLFHVKEILSPC